MAADLHSGAPMRSPVAILMRKADDGDPYYFRSKSPPAAPAPAPVLVEPGNVVDAEAQAAVNALDSTALEQLDAEVASRVQRLLGESMGANALRSPATLAQWRPIVWRALQDGKERQA